MIYTGIQLPKVGNLDSQAERKKIMNALYEIDEKLRLVLNNLDLDNLSGDLAEQFNALENAMGDITNIAARVQSATVTVNEAYDELRDLYSGLNDSVLDIIEVNVHQSSSIEQLQDRITSSVTTLTTAITNLGTLISNHSTTIQQTSEQVGIYVQKTNTLEQEQAEITQTLQTNFEFTQDGLYIGKNTSPVKTLYDNEGMTILDTTTDQVLADFTANGSHINSVETQEVSVGASDFGYFVIVVDANGFTIKKRA